MTVRTRFAPSPTGSLHVGGARTALYCLLHARHEDGKFVLRIEDTDRRRSTDEAAAGILRDMKWLGLQWDEGPEVGGPGEPYFQSQRLETYNQYIEQLKEKGLAYEAWETPEELRAMRAEARREKRNFDYRRREYTQQEMAQFEKEGRKPVLRLQRPEEDIVVDDRILGDVTLSPQDVGDFVILKADGFPTYHFAVVIDDHLMGVTQVLRGQEHLMNTGKHLHIAACLGLAPPRYGHMPLIFNPGGSKMSKRDKAKAARAGARQATVQLGHKKGDYSWLAGSLGISVEDVFAFMKKKNDAVAMSERIAELCNVDLPMIEVLDFRRGGYLPEALLNYLALLGWSPGDDREVLTMDEMVEAFTIERVGSTAARFDPDKLSWMNSEYLRSLPDERLLELHDQYLEVADSPLSGESTERRLAIFELYKPRASTFAEIDEQIAYLYERPTAYDKKAAKKWLLKGERAGLGHLADIRAALADANWTAEGIEAAFRDLSEKTGAGLGKYAQPVRIALTGTSVSPGLFQTLTLVTQGEILERIDACLQAHQD